MSKLLRLLLLCPLMLGCSSSKDTYHVRAESWSADSIQVRVYETANPQASAVSLPKITAQCRSCNLVDPPRVLAFGPEGVAQVYMPEALYELAPRIHLLGSGIDTTIILQARDPQDDAGFFQLAQPLTGRIMLTQESPLYATGAQDSTVTFARLGDQMNIFGEDAHFYLVHHPMFHEPLFLLRTNAVRLY